MQEINNRILRIIELFCGGNKAEFARLMGEKPQTISAWLVRDIGKSIVYKIANKFSTLNPTWLLTGEGEMLKPDQSIGDINNSTVVGANVNGSGNTITNNDVAGLIELQKGYQEILKEKDKQMNKSQEQIDRLLTIIENISK